MQVQQKNVTTVNLHHGSLSSFVLRKCEQEYQLSIVSADQAVHILLSVHDLQRLRYEVGKVDVRESYVVPHPTEHAGTPLGHGSSLEWLAFN
jgi:hypothetical protein